VGFLIHLEDRFSKTAPRHGETNAPAITHRRLALLTLTVGIAARNQDKIHDYHHNLLLFRCVIHSNRDQK
jgi:hypothetical protein